MNRIAWFLSVLAIPLAGCVTERVTDPPRTATEQLLISSAADRAADQLRLALPRGTKIFIDTRNFDSADAKDADAKYAAALIEDRLLLQGMAVMSDPKQADVIVALRTGALSIDDRKILVGIPAFALPVPLTSMTIPTPEVPFFSLDTQKGIAKFAATGYGAHDGLLRASTGPIVAIDKRDKRVVLLFFGSTKNEFEPPAMREMDK